MSKLETHQRKAIKRITAYKFGCEKSFVRFEEIRNLKKKPVRLSLLNDLNINQSLIESIAAFVAQITSCNL